MIYVDNVIISSNGIGEKIQRNTLNSRDKLDSKEYDTEIERSTTQDQRVLALEKSLCFLRAQQDSILKGLQAEIDSLRRTNKELQFRLVMCCCNPLSNDAKHVKDEVTNTKELQLKNEITSLNELLEAERKKNAILLQKIEAMKSVQIISKTDNHCNGALELDSESNISKESNLQTVSNRETTINTSSKEQKCSKKEGKMSDFDVTKSEFSASTMLNTLVTGSTSAYVSPSYCYNMSDKRTSKLKPQFTPSVSGLWIRRPMVESDNHDLSESNKDDSCLTGTRLTPIKLPALKGRKPLTQSGLLDRIKGSTNESNKINSSNTYDSFDSTASLSSDSDHLQRTRSARSMFSSTQMGLFDTSVDYSSDLLPKITSRNQAKPYSIGLRPILPSLPKSNNLNLISRQSKTKLSPRKRFDRDHDHYPT